MQNFKIWLTGFVCTIAVCENTLRFVVIARNCDVIAENRSANCISNKLEAIPQDLPTYIEFLHYYDNLQPNLDQNTFKNYPNLTEISFESLSFRNRFRHVDPDSFFPLKRLNCIRMLTAGYATVFHWPESISLIEYFNDAIVENVKVDNLPKLRQMSLYRVGLDDVPKLHESAPMEDLAIGGLLRNLTAESLAHYCVLKRLGIEYIQPKSASSTDYCRCAKVKKWMKHLEKVDHMLNTAPSFFTCSNLTNIPDCDFNFTAAETNRNKCLLAHSIFPSTSSPEPSSSKSWLYLLIILGISLLLIIGALCYYRRLLPEKPEVPSNIEDKGKAGEEEKERVGEEEKEGEGGEEEEVITEEGEGS